MPGRNSSTGFVAIPSWIPFASASWKSAIRPALIGNTLTLATSSGFVRDQVKERAQVKSTLEQCLHGYFKTAFTVIVILQSELVTEPLIPVTSSTVAVPPAAESVATPPVAEPAAQPERDIIAERMRQVFPGSREMGE